MGWLRALWDRIRRLLGGPGAAEPRQLTAAGAMAELRRGKERPGDRAAWERLRNRLAVLVLAEADRARLWRRARRRYGGEARELAAVDRPTEDDVRCLQALVRELEAGR